MPASTAAAGAKRNIRNRLDCCAFPRLSCGVGEVETYYESFSFGDAFSASRDFSTQNGRSEAELEESILSTEQSMAPSFQLYSATSGSADEKVNGVNRQESFSITLSESSQHGRQEYQAQNGAEANGAKAERIENDRRSNSDSTDHRTERSEGMDETRTETRDNQTESRDGDVTKERKTEDKRKSVWSKRTDQEEGTNAQHLDLQKLGSLNGLDFEYTMEQATGDQDAVSAERTPISPLPLPTSEALLSFDLRNEADLKTLRAYCSKWEQEARALRKQKETAAQKVTQTQIAKDGIISRLKAKKLKPFFQPEFRDMTDNISALTSPSTEKRDYQVSENKNGGDAQHFKRTIPKGTRSRKQRRGSVNSVHRQRPKGIEGDDKRDTDESQSRERGTVQGGESVLSSNEKFVKIFEQKLKKAENNKMKKAVAVQSAMSGLKSKKSAGANQLDGAVHRERQQSPPKKVAMTSAFSVFKSKKTPNEKELAVAVHRQHRPASPKNNTPKSKQKIAMRKSCRTHEEELRKLSRVTTNPSNGSDRGKSLERHKKQEGAKRIVGRKISTDSPDKDTPTEKQLENTPQVSGKSALKASMKESVRTAKSSKSSRTATTFEPRKGVGKTDELISKDLISQIEALGNDGKKHHGSVMRDQLDVGTEITLTSWEDATRSSDITNDGTEVGAEKSLSMQSNIPPNRRKIKSFSSGSTQRLGALSNETTIRW